MKPAIIKRSALLLALVCVLTLLGAPRASAANQVTDIRIKAALQDDGSADITQTWTATTDEGTEFHLACRDNGYLSITDFTVSDERGTYEPLASWDVGADFTSKGPQVRRGGDRRGRGAVLGHQRVRHPHLHPALHPPRP
ncbi:MAG: hypothetical protein ACLUNZ_01200 [Evtepia sp.]